MTASTNIAQYRSFASEPDGHRQTKFGLAPSRPGKNDVRRLERIEVVELRAEARRVPGRPAKVWIEATGLLVSSIVAEHFAWFVTGKQFRTVRKSRWVFSAP